MLLDYLHTQRRWSVATFGVGRKTKSICNHIRKELEEIAAKPLDLEEWIDVAILAFDGAWRTGATPEEIIAALNRKQWINRQRTWVIPEDEDAPIEHLRTGEGEQIMTEATPEDFEKLARLSQQSGISEARITAALKERLKSNRERKWIKPEN